MLCLCGASGSGLAVGEASLRISEFWLREFLPRQRGCAAASVSSAGWKAIHVGWISSKSSELPPTSI